MALQRLQANLLAADQGELLVAFDAFRRGLSGADSPDVESLPDKARTITRIKQVGAVKLSYAARVQGVLQLLARQAGWQGALCFAVTDVRATTEDAELPPLILEADSQALSIVVHEVTTTGGGVSLSGCSAQVALSCFWGTGATKCQQGSGDAIQLERSFAFRSATPSATAYVDTAGEVRFTVTLRRRFAKSLVETGTFDLCGVDPGEPVRVAVPLGEGYQLGVTIEKQWGDTKEALRRRQFHRAQRRPLRTASFASTASATSRGESTPPATPTAASPTGRVRTGRVVVAPTKRQSPWANFSVPCQETLTLLGEVRQLGLEPEGWRW